MSSETDNNVRDFVSLGMFIIDEFSFSDEKGNSTGKTVAEQIGGGGTYAAIGARIWLPPPRLGMIIDRGHDFPTHIQEVLDTYGTDMWLFRDDPDRKTTRALNAYRGEHRGFEYLTSRLRITPQDLSGTKIAKPSIIHFICSPSRACAIMSDVKKVDGWHPTTVYEPIPDRCVPEELPALKSVLADIHILSPNAEEALSLLSMTQEPTKEVVEEACGRFLDMGVGPGGTGAVVIRSGAMGACIGSRGSPYTWIDAFWDSTVDPEKVVDVTGAGNSFLGGLGAGLVLANGEVRQATLYATISASFTIEQQGLPQLTKSLTKDGQHSELWNQDSPYRRLKVLQNRLTKVQDE